jgi:MFS family permease
MYFCSAYGFWFSVTWLPTFLMKEYGLSLERSGLYSSLPLAGGAVGCIAGGALSDWLVRRTGSLKWSRRSIGTTGFLFAAAGSAGAAFAGEPFLAVLCLALAQGSHDMTLPVSWATVTDVGGRFGGTTSAFMNMASSLSAMLSSVSAAWLMQTFGSFHATLAVAAAIYAIGGVLWLRIDPGEVLDG